MMNSRLFTISNIELGKAYETTMLNSVCFNGNPWDKSTSRYLSDYNLNFCKRRRKLV